MKAWLLLWMLATGHAYPVVKYTPGQWVPLTQKQICSMRWGLDRRHVTLKMKRDVCARYQKKNCPGPRWEIDHLIPRELGGADLEANLWPEPIGEAHQKDRLENYLHRQVCQGSRTLENARAVILGDWWEAYQEMRNQ